MTLTSDLYNSRSKIDFAPIWKRSLPISLGLVVLGVIITSVFGVNRSIEFEGGALFSVPVEQSVTVGEVRDVVGVPQARIQRIENADGSSAMRVQIPTELASEFDRVGADLNAVLIPGEQISRDTVGPTWGSQITQSAVRALVLFFIVVAIYLAIRLEPKMALGALVAVVHDLVLTVTVYSILRIEVSPATVIALLTILGYSLYDTVVVYDKVLENWIEPANRRKKYSDLMNESMNQVIMRSVNTTITTVLPVASMLIIGAFLLGGDSLRGFAIALLIGLLLGTYSSIFVAAPLLAWIKERYPDPLPEKI
ncbi:MAG: protein translocase subunit SecF [Acidimicrobiales bacterium]|nr:protein translocase subunit SecF [Acidimicrobiales bacterium]